MPDIFAINSFLFQNLLRDFQVIAPPRAPVWYLSDTVIPVSLVNSQITLEANISETAMQFATEGVQVGPAAGALLADTGQLPAGRYLFRIFISWTDAGVNNAAIVQHRNAADAANNWEFENQGKGSDAINTTQEWTETLLVNERIRIQVRIVATAATRYAGIIWRRFLGPT